MPSFAIIVPCYNEATRLDVSAFISFANKFPDIQLYFANDGSTDETDKILLQIERSTPQTKIISLKRNCGKGEAVRTSLMVALNDQHEFVGYLDADLSTGLEQFLELKNILVQKEVDFVLGSRIKKIDTIIKRSFFRHVVGRVLATIIDQRFKLGVYDTQCGAKVFRASMLKNIVDQPFYTRWFFDVEILLRIRKAYPTCKASEIPLERWENVRSSKLSLLSFPAVLKDLVILLNKY